MVLALQAAGAGRAEEPQAPPVEAAAPVEPPTVTVIPSPQHGARRAARQGDRGLLHLRDGRVLEGRLVTSSEAGDAVELADGKRRVFPGHMVVEVEPLVVPEPWDGLRVGEARAVRYDGSVVTGRLLDRDVGRLELEEAGGARRTLRADEVKLLYGPAGPLPALRSGMSPARVRAIWAQTARVLDPGEVTFTSSQILTAQAAASLWHRTMFSASTTIPAGYASDSGGNVTLRATYGVELVPSLHVAGGVEAWLSTRGDVISLFGALTWGDEARWGSVYLGPPPTAAQRVGNFGDQLVSISGGWRFTPRLAAVVEAWSGLRRGDRDLLVAAAARLHVWNLDVDAGLLTSSGARIVPVLAISGTLVTP